MKCRCVIIEDDPYNLRHIIRVLEPHSAKFQLEGAAATLQEGIMLVEKKRPDLVLLDIALGEESGFALLAHFDPPPFEVVVVTGFDHYAIEALRRNAVDYLLKPVGAAELTEALNRVEKKLKEKSKGEKEISRNKFAENWYMYVATETMLLNLPSAGETRYVKPRDILLLEAANGYTRFFLQSGEQLLITQSLNSFQARLDGLGFIRCHHRHLVNRMYITKIKQDGGIMDLQLTNGMTVMVSRQHHREVRDLLAGL